MDKETTQGIDCHLHVYDDRYPYIPNPRYLPPDTARGTARQFAAVLEAQGLSHALLVGAAPYGGNNGPVLDAIRDSGGRYKGIAVLPDPAVDERALTQMHDAGIVGVRVNLALGMGEILGKAAHTLFERMAEMGWFLDIHCENDDLHEALPILEKTRVQLLVDHCGRPDVSRPLDQPGFAALLRLGAEGRAVVKLSGGFRFSRQQFPYADTDVFAAQILRVFGTRNCVWGSDWPFVNMPERVDYGPQLACLSRWLPDEADRQDVLWNTPARLFGFQQEVADVAHS